MDRKKLRLMKARKVAFSFGSHRSVAVQRDEESERVSLVRIVLAKELKNVRTPMEMMLV
jgi:hypothetical protein